jgi:hypothetical protein
MELEKVISGNAAPVSVTLTGPATSRSRETHTYTAAAGGGCGSTYTYVWSNGTKGNTLDYTFLCGDETVTVTATDPEGNTGTASVLVSVDNTISLSISGPAVLDPARPNVYTVNHTGGCGINSYVWEKTYSTGVSEVVGTTPELTLVQNCEGMGAFTLSVTVKDVKGNEKTSSRAIQESEPFSFTVLSQTDKCFGEYVNIRAYAVGGCDVANRQYQWYRPGSGGTWVAISGATGTNLYVKGLYQARFEVTDGGVVRSTDIALSYKTTGCGTEPNDPCPDDGSGIPCYDGGQEGTE